MCCLKNRLGLKSWSGRYINPGNPELKIEDLLYRLALPLIFKSTAVFSEV
jgi:hypothetical protein